MLRTRSPLSPGQALVLARLACVRRAASVRPEPGSNSPSRSWIAPAQPGGRRRSESCRRRPLVPEGNFVPPGRPGGWVRCDTELTCGCRRRSRSADSTGERRPHWLLAFTALFSRSDSPTAAEAASNSTLVHVTAGRGDTRPSRATTSHKRLRERWCQPAPSFRARETGAIRRAGRRTRLHGSRGAHVKQPRRRLASGARWRFPHLEHPPVDLGPSASSPI